MSRSGRIYGRGIVGMPEITNIQINFEGTPFVSYEENGKSNVAEIEGIKGSLTGCTSATIHFVIGKGQQIAAIKGLTKKEIDAIDNAFGLTKLQKEDLSY